MIINLESRIRNYIYENEDGGLIFLFAHSNGTILDVQLPTVTEENESTHFAELGITTAAISLTLSLLICVFVVFRLYRWLRARTSGGEMEVPHVCP